MGKYVEYLKELFEQFGPIQPRRMFGGYGLFHKGLMFGLVADDVLYLKADETASNYFKEKGLGQFQYKKNGRTIKMSYYMTPEDIFDDPDEARIWAVRAYEAAVRANNPKKKTGKKPKKKV